MPVVKVTARATTRARIDNVALRRQLFGVGGTGGVSAYRDALAGEILRQGRSSSPVNDPLNALHRDGVVGTYKKSWKAHPDVVGWSAQARAGNTAHHAVYLEFGRKGSTKPQKFSWAKFPQKGVFWFVGRKFSWFNWTRPRPGRAIVQYAVRAAAARHPALCAEARANSPYRPGPL
jgi:hypothetical protein